jgi:hypothetical protein
MTMKGRIGKKRTRTRIKERTLLSEGCLLISMSIHLLHLNELALVFMHATQFLDFTNQLRMMAPNASLDPFCAR